MSKFVCGTQSIRTLCLIMLLFTMAGCGDVDFFPEYKKLPTTPNLFSFTTKTNVELASEVTSDAITVSGLTANSPASITGTVGSNSKFSINGATAVTTGTVKNGDRVAITHTSATALGTSARSTLTIGNLAGTFTSTTVLVEIPGFASQTVAAGAPATSSVFITSADGRLPDTHKVSVKDDLNSTNAQYSIETVDFFTALEQTIPNLNGRQIFLRNRASLIPGERVETTLTIDGVSSTFTIITQQ